MIPIKSTQDFKMDCNTVLETQIKFDASEPLNYNNFDKNRQEPLKYDPEWVRSTPESIK
jgi:hypothetical protein